MRNYVFRTPEDRQQTISKYEFESKVNEKIYDHEKQYWTFIRIVTIVNGV